MKTFFSQRGAMFGLDARVALVIFAGLSGLIGYYMLSTAQESRVRGLAQDIGSIREAVNNIHRDLRVNLSTAVGHDNERAFAALYDSGALESAHRGRWNGPYIKHSRNQHGTYGTMTLVEQNNNGTACTSGVGATIATTCMVYLRMTGVPEDIVMRLDDMIDNYEGNPTPDPATQGSMTWGVDTVAADGSYWFQVRLTQAFPR